MSNELREYVIELLEEVGYAETVVTLRCEYDSLTQEDAESIVDEVMDELDLIEE